MNISDMTVGMWCWRRPQYLRRTLQSWARVDGVHDVAAFIVCLDPSDRLDTMLEVIQEAQDDGLPVTVHVSCHHAPASPAALMFGGRLIVFVPAAVSAVAATASSVSQPVSSSGG